MNKNQNTAIAFLNQVDADVAECHCGANLFQSLVKRSGEGMQIFVARGVEGKEALEQIGQLLGAYNKDCVELGQRQLMINHGVSLEWNEDVNDRIVANSDGSLTIEVTSNPAGFFPFKTRSNFKYGKWVDGLHFAAPQAAVIRMTLTTDDELTITEEIWQCKPADPRVNMAVGLQWKRLEKDGKAVKNIFTTVESAVRGIFHCGIEARRASFFMGAIGRLKKEMAGRKELAQRAAKRKAFSESLVANGMPLNLAVVTAKRLELKASRRR